jgi:hypothetical protein
VGVTIKWLPDPEIVVNTPPGKLFASNTSATSLVNAMVTNEVVEAPFLVTRYYKSKSLFTIFARSHKLGK